jgi:CRP-like cAMP-binding protein
MSSKPSTFRVGESLFQEGSDAKSLFLVKSGRVSIRKAVNGGYIEIAQVGPNQIIGEVGFFDRRPRSADAVALSYCEVVEIPYDALKPMFDPAPDYLKKIVIGLASRLREADETIRELKERLGENEIPSASAPEESPASDDSETKKVLKMTE